jgi:hypothetical protein
VLGYESPLRHERLHAKTLLVEEQSFRRLDLTELLPRVGEGVAQIKRSGTNKKAAA